MSDRILILATALLVSGPAMGQSTPPADAMPLSEIVALIEAEPGTAWIEEVEWDSDGYWEVEYHTDDGRKVEVKLDPVSGEPRR